jgi:hypothetical protein
VRYTQLPFRPESRTQALLEVGVPHVQIPQLERFASTFVMGWRCLKQAAGL